MDESNNSGENLLDFAQPTFVLAAVRMSSTEAADIVDRVMSQLPNGYGEPKYTALVRSGRGRRALQDVYAALPADAIYTYVADKRYMIIGKMVDLLVVELAYDHDYDMYADGSAVALANLLHLAGPIAGDTDLFDQMLATFVRAMRYNSTATIDELMAAITAYRATATAELGEKLWMFEASRQQAEDFRQAIVRLGLRDSLDPAIASLVALCFSIAERTGEFHLVHDASKTHCPKQLVG